MGDHEDADYEEYEGTDREDLESRVADLEDAVEKSGSSSGAGCGSAFYSLGATLAVVISWEANHAVLWAVLHGFLSWFYVIYAVVAHSDKVKLL
jgi:hypothetical protein